VGCRGKAPLGPGQSPGGLGQSPTSPKRPPRPVGAAQFTVPWRSPPPARPAAGG
jgi:hypothetical protein